MRLFLLNLRLWLLNREIDAVNRMMERVEAEHAAALDSMRSDLSDLYGKQTQLDNERARHVRY
jgi:hypothetical protein